MNKLELKEAVKEALQECGYNCIFGVTSEEAHQITQHLAGIKSLGNGDILSGFSEMQKNHVFTQERRKFHDVLVNKVGTVVVGLLTAGFLLTLYKGIMYFVKGD